MFQAPGLLDLRAWLMWALPWVTGKYSPLGVESDYQTKITRIWDLIWGWLDVTGPCRHENFKIPRPACGQLRGGGGGGKDQPPNKQPKKNMKRLP